MVILYFEVFSKNRIKMFLKIIINFDNGLKKKFYGFSVFYKVFSKNHIKIFLDLVIFWF